MTGLTTRETERLTKALEQIPALYAELILTTGRVDTNAEATHRHTAPGSQLPINLARLQLIEGHLDGSALHALTTWTQHVMTEARTTDTDLPDLVEHPTIWSECDWLLGVRWWLIHQDWAPDLLKDITTAHTTIRTALGYRHVWLPSCRNCGDTIRLIDAGGREIDPQRIQSEGMILDHAKCMGCGTVTEPGLALEQLARSTPYTLPEIHEMMGGKPALATLYRWRDQGIIQPVGTRGRGIELFDLDQVRMAAQRTRGAA